MTDCRLHRINVVLVLLLHAHCLFSIHARYLGVGLIPDLGRVTHHVNVRLIVAPHASPHR